MFKILRHYCPGDVLEKANIVEYRNQSVAVDVSIFVYKYRALSGDKWLSHFVRMMLLFKSNKIRPILVFDTCFPEEKLAEQQTRRKQRESLRQRALLLKGELETYKTTGAIGDNMIDAYRRQALTSVQRQLIDVDDTVEAVSASEVASHAEAIVSHSQALVEKTLMVSNGAEAVDFVTIRDFAKLIGVTCIDASTEAELTCADLCKNGAVSAVLSEDSDALAYGADVLLTKFNVSNGSCVRICMSNVLDSLHLTYLQFVDFCILLGTDYNTNIKFVGPDKSLSLIKQHGSIEHIRDYDSHGYDVSILKHETVRSIFLDHPRSGIMHIPEMCAPVDAAQLETFVRTHALDIPDGLWKYATGT